MNHFPKKRRSYRVIKKHLIVHFEEIYSFHNNGLHNIIISRWFPKNLNAANIYIKKFLQKLL